MNNLPIPDWGTHFSTAEFGDIDLISTRSTEFEKTIRRRNIIEYAAGAMVSVIFGYIAVLTWLEQEYLVASGWLALIIGTMLVLANLHRFASSQQRSLEKDCRSHLKTQLVRQRDALKSVDRWYIGPLVPGMVLVFVGMAEFVARAVGWPAAIVSLGMPALGVCGVFVLISLLNRRAARTLSSEIEELDRTAGVESV